MFDFSKSNEIYTYEEQAKQWKQTVPPMPTARDSPGILSLPLTLVAAGGDVSGEESHIIRTDAVEIFKADTSLWCKTDPLPTPCYDVSLTIIGDVCYALGGVGEAYTCLNQAHYASIADLLQNAVPARQSSSRDAPQSAWKRIADTPTYQPTAAVLAGNLLAIGGRKTSEGGADMKEVYMYSPSAQSCS